MNSRILITLLCAGAVALACGSLSRNDAPVAKNRSAARHEKLASVTPNKSLPAHIDGNLDVKIEPHALRFALNVTNKGKKNVELSFASGQAYDFAVQDSIGREVYRWSQGRMFTQSVQNKRIDGGDVMRFNERVEKTLPKGKYLAVATLRSTNFPITQSSEFVLR